ncbi:MAG: hypothetical protein IT393_05290 [Nitrospirae bacterium]|nr:hypothetical protein [Nitrospirota bacterium]
MPDLRAAYAGLITSGAHLILLLFAVRANNRYVWIGTVSIISGISFFAWLNANRRRLAIDDHPTARVASAPQGYVELTGICRIPAGNSPLGLRAEELALGVGHAWFRYRIEERSGNRWKTVSTGRSDQEMVLDDGTGQCFVDPEGAEIVTAHKRAWYQGDYRYTEWFILPNDKLYAIGEFKTTGGAGSEPVTDADMRLLLTDWKRDPSALLARFDRNNDKQIDVVEWEDARQAARTALEEQHCEDEAQPSVHTMSRPQDGRMYLISNLEPGKLAGRYRLWAWFHLTIFVSGVAAASGIATGLIPL